MRNLSFISLRVLTLLIILTFSSSIFAFNGKKAFKMKCSGCHSLGDNRMVGPGLKDVTKRKDKQWLIKFTQSAETVISSGDEYTKKLVKEYGGMVMPDQELTDEEVSEILRYIETGEFTEDAPTAEVATKIVQKKGPTDYGKIAIFVIFAMCFVLAGAFLAAKKENLKYTKQVIAIVILTTVLFAGFVTLVKFTRNIGFNQGYEPTQPIAFSHKLHAGENKISCMYCHFGADKSRHAGIPPTELCMNCHTKIKVDSPEIQKIASALESGKNIEWIKVNQFPDHAYFNHSQHVNVAKIDCQKCHGQVDQMDIVRQEKKLAMGWCLDCHRESQIAPPNDHKGKAGADCSKCHY